MAHSVSITIPKKGNLQICNNYRTISLISHPSKVMLKVLLSRLKPQEEEIIAEEQAGFRTARSTIEQIFNLRIIYEKYLQHQQDLYHVFIDFKKAFDREWPAALWTILRQYNIGNNLIHVIQRLYQRATSAVFINGNIGEWFHTTVGVRQGCILSPTLFNIFLERIMSDVLEEHEGTVSIAGRTITNLRFADDIDGLAGSEHELAQLALTKHQKITAWTSMLKKNLMTNNINGIHKEIKASDHKLQTVTNFKYLGAIISDEWSKDEIFSRIAQCTTTMTRLKPIWNDQNITLRSKVRLMRTLIISILLYACETGR